MSEASFLAQAVEHILPRSVWTVSLLLVVVTLTAGWSLWRRRSRKRIKQPRPLKIVAQETKSEQMFEKRQQILRIISNNKEAFLQGKLEVWHLATKNPVTIALNQSVESACTIMEERDVDHLLVCEKDGTLLGLISKHYLQRTNLRKIADAMVTEPLFVAPDAMLNATVTHMLNEDVSCVAVVEDGKAVGTLTTTDIQLTLQAALQILAKITNEEQSAVPC